MSNVLKVLLREKQEHIKCLRTDPVGERTSGEFDEFCAEQGIKRQLTANILRNKMEQRKGKIKP